MIYGITYSDGNMTMASKLCRDSMLKNGVDNAYELSNLFIDEEFEKFNQDIFDGKRGAGCYWLFKPYLIYSRLLKLSEGDILIYSDAGVEFINNVSHIIDKMDEDIFFFTNGFSHVEWCKGDVMNAINGWGKIRYEQTRCGEYEISEWSDHLMGYRQVQASVIFFKVNQKTKDFVKEWLLYCQMPGFIDDSPSKLPNYPTFAEHRHDQAILTCLQIKYGYKIHFWPTNYSEHIRHTARPEDTYPTMFNHHRKRNNEF